MVDTEMYNLIALSGLLLGKSVLLLLILYYCCKKPIPNEEATTRATTADSADQTEEVVVKIDAPPSYTKVVLKTDPPCYLDSMMNAELNPEMNRSWARDLLLGRIDPELRDIVTRSRNNSICPNVPANATENRRASTASVLSANSMDQRPPPLGAFWIGV